MQIDRSNYEIWLIDWLDGNLNDSQAEQLRHFLTENPDLKEESEEVTMFRINPSVKSYLHKNELKKTTSDLPMSQFEYFSVAYLEDDLNDKEKTGLFESIENDQEKKFSFELVQRIKLSPGNFSYAHKNRLLKRSIAQNAIRWSLIGLTAAAIITLVIITIVSKPHELNIESNKTSQTVSTDSAVPKQAAGIASNYVKEGRVSFPDKIRKKSTNAESLKPSSAIPEIKKNHYAENDPMPELLALSRTIIDKINVPPSNNLIGVPISNTLIAISHTKIVQEYDDGRSKLSRFIAKTFREKILKETKAKDSPLKAYELAKASVSGLDKLFGWDMALDERKDANGTLKSVYFSSKILKFNAPIKNTGPLP
jgi:hypothetical protein